MPCHIENKHLLFQKYKSFLKHTFFIAPCFLFYVLQKNVWSSDQTLLLRIDFWFMSRQWFLSSMKMCIICIFFHEHLWDQLKHQHEINVDKINENSFLYDALKSLSNHE